MKQRTQQILVPVDTTDGYLPIVQQACSLAERHNANIYLLHTIPYSLGSGNIMGRFSEHYSHKIASEKWDYFNRWVQLLKERYSMPINLSIEWGNWNSTVLQNAEKIEADYIVLKQDSLPNSLFSFRVNRLENIIARKQGQVIVLNEKNAALAEWRSVVLPIEDFIPFKRIKTLIDIAKLYGMTVHIISSIRNEVTRNKIEFKCMEQTLRLFKAAGNIQVDCQFLPEHGNKILTYLDHCRLIHADALMTGVGGESISTQSSFLPAA